jgi:hypothetical protein
VCNDKYRFVVGELAALLETFVIAVALTTRFGRSFAKAASASSTLAPRAWPSGDERKVAAAVSWGWAGNVRHGIQACSRH